ncbi:hypothetical protein [Devosia sp.]
MLAVLAGHSLRGMLTRHGATAALVARGLEVVAGLLLVGSRWRSFLVEP